MGNAYVTLLFLFCFSVPYEISVLKQYYNIEEVFNTHILRKKENGLLKHFCISPLFHRFSRIFLRQIILYCNISGLFHLQYPRGSSIAVSTNFTVLLIT